jgi:uncharacterized membrane protein YphA (DoxX/SURF4 family)
MNLLTVAVWVLAAVCFASGVFNALGNAKVLETFRNYGYPRGWHLVTGFLEIIGAVLLVIPSTRLYGAVLLGVVMLAAFITVLPRREVPAAVSSAVLLGLAVFIALKSATIV